jgi:hypothetical protein
VPARLARVLLVISLLAGWQAALQHPIEHVDELGALVHVPGGHGEGSVRCDVLAALTVCAPDKLAFANDDSADHVVPSYFLDAPRVAQALPFLSQGPPVS